MSNHSHVHHASRRQAPRIFAFYYPLSQKSLLSALFFLLKCHLVLTRRSTRAGFHHSKYGQIHPYGRNFIEEHYEGQNKNIPSKLLIPLTFEAG